ncbi:unnamed protein product [Urochloa humidicola]
MAQEEHNEPLSADQPGAAPSTGAGRRCGFSWLTAVGFGFLTFNRGMDIDRSRGDRGAVASPVLSYIDLVRLFACLRWYERAESPGSTARCKLKEIPNSTKDVTASTFIHKWLSIFRAPDPDDVNEDFKAPCELSSSASVHAVGKARMLQSYSRYSKPWPIKMADGRFRKVVGHGNIKWGSFIIPNVRHVQGLHGILISVNQLDRDHDLWTTMGSGICLVTQRSDGTIVGRGTQTSTGVYALNSLHVPETAN